MPSLTLHEKVNQAREIQIICDRNENLQPGSNLGVVFASTDRECRVRLHQDELARIEVPLEGLALLAAPGQREALAARFRELGFRFVTLDLEGFRSGNLNELVSLEQKRLFTKGA